MENGKDGAMGKPKQPANDMARAKIFPPFNTITVDKTDTNPTKQDHHSSDDAKATLGKQVRFSSFDKAPRSAPQQPTQNRGIFAGTTYEEFQAHLKAKGVKSSPYLVSMTKQTDEKEKSKMEKEKLAKSLGLMTNQMRAFMEGVERGPCDYGNYEESRMPKDKKVTGYANTHGKPLVPAGEKMYAPANPRGKFITPKDKMLGQGDSKEQLLDGEYQSVSKDEAEEEWTIVS